MGEAVRVIVADFEGIFREQENVGKRKTYGKFLIRILTLFLLFGFILYFKFKKLMDAPFFLILLVPLAPLAAREVFSKKEKRSEVRKESRLEILSFSKDELRNPRSIAMKLLNLYPFHTAREPSIYVVICELSSDTVHRLIELAKHIKSMLRKNVAKLLLYTYPSLKAVNNQLCEVFDQIILYDGDVADLVWNWKLYALKKAIEYCSEELAYEQPGVAIICYNSFSVSSNLNYDQLKFELMSTGIPLFSNSEPFMENGKEIVFCACPEHLKSEIERILINESLENQVKVIGNSDAVEVFTVYHASGDILVEIVDAVNSQFDLITEIKSNVQDYEVVAIIEPTNSDIPLLVNREMYESVKDLKSLPEDKRAKALFDLLVSKMQYKESQRYRNSLEVFYDGGGVCGELSFLYISLARAIGLKSGYVHVNVDLFGKEVNHACAWVDVGGREVLVDLAYGIYDVEHKKYEKISDREVFQRFMCWREG